MVAASLRCWSFYDCFRSFTKVVRREQSNEQTKKFLHKIFGQFFFLFIYRYNLIFLLSAAGKFNYMGTRQWIDNYLEQSGTRKCFVFGTFRCYNFFLEMFRKCSRIDAKIRIRNLFGFFGGRFGITYARIETSSGRKRRR